MKKFQDYTFEDFVNDRSFVKWVLNPSPATNHFWYGFIERYPEKKDDIRIASKIITSSASENNYLSDKEVDELWVRIRKTSGSHRHNYRIIAYTSIAATFLLLLGFGLWYFEFRDKVPRFVDYKQIQIPEIIDNQVQLVLSDDSKIYLDDNESTLMYRNDGKLQTNVQEISVKEPEAYVKGKDKDLKIAMNQIIVPNGKRSSIVFSDGTKLWLNSGSRAIYPVNFAGNRREIFLEGEAFLEVASDKTMPFIVKTDIMEVQVLGTSFNIKVYPDEQEASVVLVEGVVNVKAGRGKEKQMLPDQLLSFSSVTGMTEIKENVNILEHIGWKYGWLLCNSESLGSVFTKLSRYYNVNIEVDNPDIRSFKINGKLDLKEELNEVMRAVSIAGSFAYTIENDKVLISGKSKRKQNNI